MSRIIILLICLVTFFKGPQVFAQNQANIKIINAEHKDTTALIAYHYGDRKLIYDTVDINSQGEAWIRSDSLIEGGIYLMVYPNQQFFEFIIADDQEFTLETAPNNYIVNMKVTGSVENDIFYKDMKYLVDKRAEYDLLANRLKIIRDTKPDSAAILESRLGAIDSLVINNRKAIKENNKGSFYSKFLYMLEEPEIKEPKTDEEGNVDSTYPYRYYKAHFFDNVDFSDKRILRTPVYHTKIKKYVEDLIVKHPDSVIVDSDYLIAKSQASRPLFQYTLAFILNKYAKRKLMGFDAVYVHLAEKYYMNSALTDWVSEKSRKKIADDAIRMKPLLIGKTAPNFSANDINGKVHTLHDLEAEFTILYFWDADCGHCRKETPKLHDLYLEWKGEGVKVFAVTIELTDNHWKKFIEENELGDWINLIDLERKSVFRTWYNLKGTPVVFILDKNKKIIAKRLAVDQIGDFLEFENAKKKEKEG